jgi:hypothetical protein
MTTKPKARKAPAKAARKTRAKPAPSINKIEVLIARWKWCEADQDYQTALAPPERDADRRHDAEQEMIIAKLRICVPQNFRELEALSQFAINEIKLDNALRGDGADLDILINIVGALPDVVRSEQEISVHAGMQLMRRFLDKETVATFAYASDPEIIQKIRWGNA